MTTIHDLAWGYWFLTVGFLGAGLFGWPAGIYLAMLLCAIQIGHMVWLTRDLTAFPVQVSFPLVRRTFLSLQAAVPPCGEVFRRTSLERVQG